ncbi:MAG: transketolase [Eubacteriales bacterium]|nr:transketolase [Eubacteriales bacterium]
MLDSKQETEFEILAAEIRLETFRELAELGFGHIGGAMSIADVLAVLYGGVMKIDPENPAWEDRDYFALSKGHAGPAVYAALALRGFFLKEQLKTLNKSGTMLPSHCSRIHTPGIDLTTGSLGQGISTAAGAALASRILGGDNYAYCIIGDGECDEGQIWEAALFAAHQKLDHFILFVDANKLQLDGPVAEICCMGDIGEKFRSFNWHVQTVDGHSVAAIYRAIEAAKAAVGQPSVVVLETIKGKGCALAEEAAAKGQGIHHMLFPDQETNRREIARMEQVVSDLKAKRGSR